MEARCPPAENPMIPMLSLSNTYSEQELREFDKRVQGLLRVGEGYQYTAELKIGILNDGNYKIENVRVSAYIFDLEEYRTAGPFDVEDNQEETAQLYLDIPNNAEPGTYDIRIIVSNDNFRHIEHRTITII